MIGGAIVIGLNLLQVLVADTGWERAWPGASAGAWVAIMAPQVVMGRRLLAADALAEVGPWGIRVNVLGRGWVSLSWDAVGGVRRDWARRVVVKPAAGVDPFHPRHRLAAAPRHRPTSAPPGSLHRGHAVRHRRRDHPGGDPPLQRRPPLGVAHPSRLRTRPIGETRVVTAPVSWTSADRAPSAPPLVVRPDRRRARRWLTVILGLNGMIAVVCVVAAAWASSTSMGAWGGLPFGITLAGCVFQMVFHAFFYGRLLGADSIGEIGPAGVRGPTKQWVQVTLPWSSIASVTSGWNVVIITPVAGAGSKLVIPSRATTTDVTTIRAAIAHFSGGRL